MVAGGMTKSNVIGFVGGIELPPIKAAYEAWVGGAQAVNPKVEARQTYLNSFDDAAAGREAALALIRVGADMLHHNADAAALGVFQAAKESAGGVRLRGELPTRRRSRRTACSARRSSTCPERFSWWRGRCARASSSPGSSRSDWRAESCATSPTPRWRSSCPRG